MPFLRTPLLLLLICVLLGCNTLNRYKEPTETVAAALTQEQAVHRKKMVGDIEYDLFLDLTDSATDFSGRIVMQLEVLSPSSPLRIDFYEGKISELLVNEQSIKPDYNGFFLTVPQSALNKGQNLVEIRFQQSYREVGGGLHRFVDPDDQRVYLYSDFEPYSANRMFPVLDQPDLKARFKLSAKVPVSWEVISARREQRKVRDGAYRWWYFPASETISPYIFGLHAGPYALWEDRQFHIPLRIMARQSKKQYVSHESLFQLTRQGIRFMETYLDQPFPFSKYDQVIVPEFEYAGMEIAGATILHEDVLTEVADKTPDPLKRWDDTQLVLHELAHMWFGNLVTPLWWDDLWLKEGMAEFMAYFTMKEAGIEPDSWMYFTEAASLSKQEAYGIDRLSLTHSVVYPVPDTKEADRLLADIVYGKSAAMLQHLQQRLGSDAFRQGLRGYLQRSLYNNAGKDAFLESMEQASGISLEQWQEEWLSSAGVNKVQADFACKKGELDSIILYQTKSSGESPSRRHQNLSIALTQVKNNQLMTLRTLKAFYSGKQTKVAIPGHQPCPDAIFPNSDDTAYVQVNLDKQSLESAVRYPANDPELRLQTLIGLKQQLADGTYSLMPYSDTLFKWLESETHPLVQYRLEEQVYELYRLSQRLLPAEESTRKPLLELMGYLESFSWQQMDIHVDEASQRWFDRWLDMVHTDGALNKIEQLLDGKVPIKTFDIKPYQRWKMLHKLSEYSRSGVDKRIQQAWRKGRSDDEDGYALMAKAAAPSIDNKRYWLHQLLDENSTLTSAEQEKVMESLFPDSQQSQWRFMAQEVIDGLPEIAHHSDSVQAQYVKLLSNECSEAGVARLDHELKRFREYRPIMEGLERTRNATLECIRVSKRIGY